MNTQWEALMRERGTQRASGDWMWSRSCSGQPKMKAKQTKADPLSKFAQKMAPQIRGELEQKEQGHLLGELLEGSSI